MQFRYFAESGMDIFGFEKKKDELLFSNDLDNKPIKTFNTELMMQFLSRSKIGVNEATVPFMNEIIWGGNKWGAIKLEVSPRMTFLISRLAKDIEGNPRWISKKCYQLDRTNPGGNEESVAAEIFDQIKQVASGGLEGPNPKFDKLANLTEFVAEKMNKCAQSKFLFRGIKKVNENNYQIIFEVGGQGVEAKDHRRVEQNVTDISYDSNCGTINLRNYNIESKVGGPHSWSPMPAFLNLYFFPSQDRSEIADPSMILMKYY